MPSLYGARFSGSRRSVLDLHCHLLPGLDDGPADLTGTVALARRQVAEGVRMVACTPHVDWDTPNTSERIHTQVDVVRTRLAAEAIDLEIVAGAEVGLTRALQLEDTELCALRLGGGPWLLLEAPLSSVVGVEQAIASVMLRGHRILLAHPERCPAFQRDVHSLRRLVEGGVACQVTASSLVGAFGRTVERFARHIVAERLVHVVASDAHDAHRRPPGLSAQIATAGLQAWGPYWTVDVPAALLAGTALPRPPALTDARPKRSRFRR